VIKLPMVVGAEGDEVRRVVDDRERRREGPAVDRPAMAYLDVPVVSADRT